jgi:capsular polysaccharide export protein
MKYVLVENIENYGLDIKKVICEALRKLGYFTISLGNKSDYCDYWERSPENYSGSFIEIDEGDWRYDILGSSRRYPSEKESTLKNRYFSTYTNTVSILENYNIEFVVTWGGLLLSSRAIKKACDLKGVKVYATEFSFDKDRIYFDDLGIIGNKHQYSTMQNVPPLNDKNEQKIKTWVDKCEHSKSPPLRSKFDDLDLANSFYKQEKVNILILGQCNVDTVITYDCPNYSSTIFAYKDLLDKLHHFKNINVLVKLHPGDKEQYKKEIQELVSKFDEIQLVDNEVNTYSLMEVFDKGITINSQTGLEMLAHGKNVLTLGESFYTNQGFGLRLSDYRLLEDALKTLIETEVTDIDKKKIFAYLYSYLYEYLIDRNNYTDLYIAKKIGFYKRNPTNIKLLIIHPSGCDHGSAFYLQELSEKLKLNPCEVMILSEGPCPMDWNGIPWIRLSFQGYLLNKDIKNRVILFKPDFIMQVGVRTKTMRAALELHLATNAKLIVQAEDDEDAVFMKYYPNANIEILNSLDKPKLAKDDLDRFLSLINLEETLRIIADPYYSRWVDPILRVLCYKLSVLHCSIWDNMADRLYEKFAKPSFILPPVVDTDEFDEIKKINFSTSELFNKFNIKEHTFKIFINGSIYPYSDEFEKFVLSMRLFSKIINKPITFIISGKAPLDAKLFATQNLKGYAYLRDLKSPSEIEYNQMILASDIICAPGNNDDFNQYRMSSRLVKAVCLDKPILTFKIGFAESLNNLEHGYFCKYDTEHEWAFLLLSSYLQQTNNSAAVRARKLLVSRFSSVKISRNLYELLVKIKGANHSNTAAIAMYARNHTSYDLKNQKFLSDDDWLYVHTVYQKIIHQGVSCLTENEFIEILVCCREKNKFEIFDQLSMVSLFFYPKHRGLYFEIASSWFSGKNWIKAEAYFNKLIVLFSDVPLSIYRRLSICQQHLGNPHDALINALKCRKSKNKADLNGLINIIYHMDEKGIDVPNSLRKDISDFIIDTVENAVHNNEIFNRFLRAVGESYKVSEELLEKLYFCSVSDNASIRPSNIASLIATRAFEQAESLKCTTNEMQYIADVKSNFGETFLFQKLANQNENIRSMLVMVGDKKVYEHEKYEGKTAVVYLPHVFYNVSTEKQKQTNQDKFFIETRNVFLMIISSLQARNVGVIFKNQFHNGKIDTRTIPTKVNYVFSHHTRSLEEEQSFVHFHVKQSPISGYVMVDTKGYSGWATSADIKADDICAISDLMAEEFFSEKCEPIIENKVTKYTQSDADFIVEGEYVFCAMQLLTDSVANLAYLSSLEMVQNTVKALENTKYKVVIKRHPFCNNRQVTSALELLARNPNVIISEADIHKIIPNCNAVLTVNSGVGLEALIMGKKVFITGRAEYSPVSIKLYNNEDFVQLINELELDTDVSFINKFLYLYFKNVLVDAYCPDNNQIDSLLNRLLESNTINCCG